jgi:D-aminopeptidase
MRNLHPQDLGGQAMLITGRHKPLYMMEGLDGSFDGVCFVSYHGSIGGERAVLSHTYNPGAIWEVRLNGEVVGESGINALVAAHYVVPIIFVSGDEVTVREAEIVAPKAEKVVVKQSLMVRERAIVTLCLPSLVRAEQLLALLSTMRSIVVHRVRLFAETGAASLSTFEAINHIGEDIETLLKLQGLLVQCAYFADNFVELTV